MWHGCNTINGRNIYSNCSISLVEIESFYQCISLKLRYYSIEKDTDLYTPFDSISRIGKTLCCNYIIYQFKVLIMNF